MPELRDIARSFAASRTTYDGAGSFHLELAKTLVTDLKKSGSHFSTVLEIGAHTGLLTIPLRQLLGPSVKTILCDLHAPASKDMDHMPWLLADGERLPFAPRTFDLICSSSTFQWFRDRNQALSDILACLKPGGLLAFSQFLQPSLEPLRSIFAKLGEESRFLHLDSADNLRLRLQNYTVESFQLCEKISWHPDLQDMLEILRRLGANISPRRHQPLDYAKLKNILSRLEALRTPQGLPLHWCAAVVVLRKPV